LAYAEYLSNEFKNHVLEVFDAFHRGEIVSPTVIAEVEDFSPGARSSRAAPAACSLPRMRNPLLGKPPTRQAAGLTIDGHVRRQCWGYEDPRAPAITFRTQRGDYVGCRTVASATRFFGYRVG
jgi:hypothetical protein